MMQSVNPDMIKLAREVRMMSQKELANHLGVSQGTLSKLENEFDMQDNDDLLENLAKSLHFPQEFFLQPGEIKALGNSLFFHRKRQSMPARILNRIHGEVNIVRMHLLSLVDEGLAKSKIPQMTVGEDGEPDEIARKVRKLFKLRKGPVNNITAKIEQYGGIVVPFDFGAKKIDGLSFWLDTGHPIFVVNSEIPGDRWRFTLAHELGHIVMHDVPFDEMENEANTFASEFLLPAAEVCALLTGLTIKKLSELKIAWKVSMAALLVRADRLGLVDERSRQSLWIQFSRAGYRRAEPNGFPREKVGTLYTFLGGRYREYRKSLKKLSMHFNITEEYFQYLYKAFCKEGFEGVLA